MNALKTLNKEQWAAAGAGGVGLLLLLGGLGGGLSVQVEAPPAAVEVPYEKLPARHAELPDDKFERYWSRGFVSTQVASRLPAPYLSAPQPREADLAAPLFRPSPSTEAYNKGPVKLKYPFLIPGSPLIPEAQLPPDLAGLAKMPEPDVAGRPDRRNERERPLAVLVHVNGRKYEGESYIEAQGVVRFKEKSGAVLTFPRGEVKELLSNDTLEDLYKKESKAIPAGPRSAEARVKLARKLLDQGMMPEAREELNKALEAKADLADALLLSVQLKVEAADLEGALAALAAAEESGESSDVHYERGRILRLMGVHEGAALSFEKAAGLSPRHAAARVGWARALLDSGRPDQAEAVAADFLAKMGGAPDIAAKVKAEAYTMRGLAALRQGEIEKARGDAGEALKLDPAGAEATNLLGAVLCLDGAWQAAGAEFVKAVKADPYLSDAWTNLGTLCLLAGKWADAEALYGAAAQRDPASAEAVAGLGMVQLMTEKKEAIATFEKALSIDPRHLQALLGLGHVHLQAGADDAALERYREALASDPTALPAYAGAAAAYLRTARVIAGRADAVKLDPARAEPLFKQAAERRVSAETLIKTLKDSDPSRPGAWTALGCAYAGMGRAEEARQALRTAANLLQQAGKPVDPLIYYGLGYLEYYHGAGATEEARMEAALPEFENGAKLRDTLKDPFSVRVAAECAGVAEAIEEWKVTSLRFEDAFEREPGKSLGPHWIESDGTYGIAASLEKSPVGGRIKFAGRQAIHSYGLTQIAREIPGANFLSFEATLFPEKADRAEFGMSLYYHEQGGARNGFHVGIDGQGRLRYNATAADPRDMDKKDMALGWTEIKTPLPAGPELRIRLNRTDKNRQSFLTINAWDAARGQWTPLHKEISVNLSNVKDPWRAGLFVRAPVDTDVVIWADNLRVYERQGK